MLSDIQRQNRREQIEALIPKLAEVAAAGHAKVASRREGQTETRELCIFTFEDLPGVMQKLSAPRGGGEVRRSYTCAQLAGFWFETAEDLLRALRWELEHPNTVPPGVLSPAQMAEDDGDPAPRRDHRQRNLPLQNHRA